MAWFRNPRTGEVSFLPPGVAKREGYTTGPYKSHNAALVMGELRERGQKGVVTMAQIRSGYARNKYGLDTSAGSRYAYLRSSLGWSDVEAQADIFGVGRESGKPGIGVPLKLTPDQLTPEELREAVVMSLGTLSEKALEGRMNLMTGPRIMEAAKDVRKGRYRMAIGWLNEVAGLGPAEVTRRAKLAIKDIEHIQGMG
jgi:hypothetical protein